MLRRQRRPQQWGHRIARGNAIKQRKERLLQARLALRDPLAPAAGLADPPRWSMIAAARLLDPAPDRRLGDPCRADYRRDPATPMRRGLRRRPHPTTPRIQSPLYDQPPLPNRPLINHRPRHDDP